jgi:hypothetical protein
MLRTDLLKSCLVGLAALLLQSPSQAQGNIDKGKTPAQVFAETCSACHRGPRALKRTSAAFLREHYSVSAAEASTMAAYLAGLPSEPPPQSKRSPASGTETRADPTKQQSKRQQSIAATVPGTAERSQTAPSQPSDEPLANGSEVSPAPPVADPSVTPAPSPKPVLETFEE